MKIREYAEQAARKSRFGARCLDDRHYRTVAKAVCSLIFHLAFSFYYALIGVLSKSPIFATSALYYLLLAVMRFAAVTRRKSAADRNQSCAEGQRPCAEGQCPCAEGQRPEALIGILLILLSIILHIMVLVSMKYQSAAVHGTIPMIAIATFTFTKITAAIVSAVKHRHERSRWIRALDAVRYSEVAVSLLTMQQSMLASFGDATQASSVILNACTGAGVCFLILALGILTLKKSEHTKQ